MSFRRHLSPKTRNVSRVEAVLHNRELHNATYGELGTAAFLHRHLPFVFELLQAARLLTGILAWITVNTVTVRLRWAEIERGDDDRFCWRGRCDAHLKAGNLQSHREATVIS